MKPSKKTAPVKKIVPETIKKRTTEKSNRTPGTSSLFDNLENHFNKKQNIYLVLCIVLAAVFSFLCFDVKISLANDDALYIESGAKYAKDFFAKESFYLANAPLYPTLLGLIIKVFGVNLMVLKSFSILFFCTGILFIFTAFRNRIPFLILIPSLLLTSINFPFLMYASLTYSECLYLLVIGCCFYIFFKCFDKIFTKGVTYRQTIVPTLVLGSTSFLFLITRNIAIIAIVPIVLFLVYRKKYAESVIALSVYAFFYFFYRFIIKLVWHVDQSQYTGQKLIFQKDAYNPALGMETTAGYINRLIENSQIYISQRFMYVLGFRPEISVNNPAITLLGIGLVTGAIYLMMRNKQYILLFSTLFFSTLLGATFVALQTSWGQTRFIMIYLPLILMTFFYLLYVLGKKVPATQYLYLFVISILTITSLKLTFKNVRERFPVFLENIQGDPTYGYTPDWQNYIKMSIWCKNNLPNENIAVRKAPMSFIFSGGKEFYPIYGTPTQNPDSLLMPLRENKVNYIMPAELRANPDMYIQDQIIGTVHRYMYYIQLKYPNAFEFVHQEGDMEKSQLYKIRWDNIDSVQETQE